jgi:transcriptional regulator with XRE-family HTH domain
VAAEVRAEMARQEIPQRVLAERLGWPQPRLSRRVTSGPTFVAFTIDELAEVARALNVPVTQFLGGEPTGVSAA